MSLTALRMQLKNLRNEHTAKPVSKMTESEIQSEIMHHEMGCKARALKEARMTALAKARESRAKSKTEDVPDVKVPEMKKKTTKTEQSVPVVPKKSSAPKKSAKVEAVEEVKEVKKPASRAMKMMKVEDDDE